MLFYTLAVNDIINQILGYVDQAFSVVNAQTGWLQLIIYLAVAIFVLIGFFVFIKKFIKVFLVLAVLGVAGYYLWTSTNVLDFIKNMLPGATAFITGTPLFW